MLVGLWGADKAERREWSGLETEGCDTATLSLKLQRVSPVQGTVDSDRLGEELGQLRSTELRPRRRCILCPSLTNFHTLLHTSISYSNNCPRVHIWFNPKTIRSRLSIPSPIGPVTVGEMDTVESVTGCSTGVGKLEL